MNFSFGDDLRHQVSQNLSSFSRMSITGRDLRDAAVAIIIARQESNDDASVLLTLRPQHMNRHSGQFALPGGRLDENETVLEAALRETVEEIGLRLEEDALLGQIDDYPTRSGFRISPLVFWANDSANLTPDPNEVEKVFRIPFSELNEPSIPDLSDAQGDNHPVLSALIPSLGGRIYAPTAALLFQFREVALRGNNTRVAHFEQPEFAWK